MLKESLTHRWDLPRAPDLELKLEASPVVSKFLLFSPSLLPSSEIDSVFPPVKWSHETVQDEHYT